MKRLFILFLLISTVSASDFNVSWTPIKEDIVNKEYLVTVQNLKDEMRTVDMKSFFEDTNFDTSQVHDIQLIECGSKKFESKVLKKNKLEKEVSHGKITFPSVKSIGKKNNKGTKTFILKFKTPPDGSYGKVGLKINGKEYHPYWNSTWSNRKKITLTGNTSGSQTDYQLLLNVTYESEMNSDFSDLRFCNDTDQLSAWLESKVNESYALIWVKFPHTPANGETEDYWMYYGNSEAGVCWDGEATFEFFDDFETGDLTTGPMSWTPRASTEHDGVAHIDCSGGTYQQMYVASSLYENTAWAFDWKKIESGDTTFIFGFISNVYNWGVFNGLYDFEITGSNIYIENDRINHIISTTWANDLFDHTFEVTKDGAGNFELFIDGVSKGTAHDTEFSSSSYMSFWEHNYVGIDIDNFRVRKYTSSEPTYTYGDTRYYVDSIYFSSSNPYYNLIDYKGDIAINHSYSSSDDLEWTTHAVDDDTGLVVTSMGSSEIDFTTYEGILDWLQLINLDDSKIYTLQNSSGDIEEHQASGNAVNFTTDLSPDNYEIEITAVPTPSPTITPTGVQPANYSSTKLSDNAIKALYYPFMYILFIVIIIGGFMHVFGD